MAAEQEPKLRRVLEAAGIGIWNRDLRTNKVVRSPLIDRLFGFVPGEAGDDAAPFFARLHPEDAPLMLSRIAAGMRSPERTKVVEFRVVWPDGSVHWLLARGEFLDGPEGAPERLMSLISDITARKETELALHAAVVEKQGLLEQKEALLAEVHHRVKNNLQVILSLLNLQTATVGADLQAHLAASQQRIRAMSRVHEQLYQTSEFGSIEFGRYLRQLCADIAATQGIGDDRVRVTIEAPDLAIQLNTAIPLALILNEAISNSYKHAFSGRHHGEILILAEVAGGNAVVTVSDDGVGLPSNFEDQGGTSMGVRLIRVLAKQIEGEASWRKLPGGCCFVLRFPIAAAESRAVFSFGVPRHSG